jgi:NADH-quinone oxidoreductase subunit M
MNLIHTQLDQSTSPLLGLLVVLPFLAAAVVALVQSTGLARIVAISGALATLGLAAWLGFGVINNFGGTELVWMPDPSFTITGPPVAFAPQLALNGVSVWLVLLSALLVPLAMLSSIGAVRDHEKWYLAWMLVLLGALLGAFTADDVLLFYVFFEVTLIPAYFLISGWGDTDRKPAAGRFFLFTFAGSVFMLAAIVFGGVHAQTFQMDRWIAVVQSELPNTQTRWILAGLLIGLLVKVPVMPLHSWLAPAYTQAPAPVTALLSGAMAKLGTYGLLVIVIPAGFVEEVMPGIPGHTRTAYALIILSTLSMLVMAVVAWVQSDIRAVLAYASISHLALCVLAMLALSRLGLQASVLYMVNHGIISGALFLLMGMIERRTGTREINQISGLGRDRPLLSFFLVLFAMASVGLPLTNGFVSEFLSIQAVMSASHMGVGLGVVVALGIVLGAMYMLRLTGVILFGPAKETLNAAVEGDLSRREVACLVPLAVLVIVLGVRPGIVTDTTIATLKTIRTPVAQLADQSTRQSDVQLPSPRIE